MKKLYNVRYAMDMGCGRDFWRIFGTYNGKSIFPSTPVDFDSVTDTFKTVSGSVYYIQSYDCDKEQFVQQIHKDILKKSYERH